VTKMDSMFQDATSFQQKLCGTTWIYSKASKNLMFEGSSGSVCTTVFSTSSKEELLSAVKACLERSPTGHCSSGPRGLIGDWDVSTVTDMDHIFSLRTSSSAARFDADISKWDVSGVKNMFGMFWGAASFNGNLSEWNVSSMTDMDYMFFHAAMFNSDISKWDVSSVQGMYSMFWDARSFNGDISQWDVSRVLNMANMFCDAAAFNSDISKWDVSSVEDMYNMFRVARSFSSDISKWDTSNVASMGGMFSSAIKFNRDISKWDVSSVTDMSHMFSYASSFNGKISKWDVSQVTDMSDMFSCAKSFNGDISDWEVSSVINMYYMFRNTTSFTRKLCSAPWVESKASQTGMFGLSDGSIARTACDRELIAVGLPIPASVSTPAIASTCPKCGTFRKSGRASCCAPGGTWYKNCGGVGDGNVDHSWLEGVAVCKGKFSTSGILMYLYPFSSTTAFLFLFLTNIRKHC